MPRQSAPPRDAEATRLKILEAAIDEFAANGLLGARTEAIAARTGVTKAMIYYYFKSKEALYEAVLESAIVHRMAAIQSLQTAGASEMEILEAIISSFLEDAARNPKIPAIMMYEAMQNKGQYYKKVGVLSVYGAIEQALERGMASGLFRKLDAKHTAVNIIGTCMFYFCSRENIKALWDGEDLLDPAMVAQHKEQAMEFILNGILNKQGV